MANYEEILLLLSAGNKYELLQMDRRIIQYAEVVAKCDKSQGRRSNVASIVNLVRPTTVNSLSR